jgi:hypothetical protein
MGYLPEIQSMKFKAVTADIRDELLKLERSFNSQNYKFGVLYCKKGQTENEMFTNGTCHHRNHSRVVCYVCRVCHISLTMTRIISIRSGRQFQQVL